MGKLQSVYLKIPNCIKNCVITAYGYVLKGKRQEKYYQTTYKWEKDNDKLDSKAKELLGYAPEWSFERGIKAAIEWYRENL